MPNASIIGAVDLTVQLTSMNPLGHIDANEASRQFERLLIQAAWSAVRQSKDKEDLLAHGLIVEGPGAKYFRVRRLDDLLHFCTRVRSLLVESRLPFKLCSRTGILTNTALRDKWQPVLDMAEQGDGTSQESLLEEFNTKNLEEIREIFDIYRAPGFKNDAVKLALDIENFKGLGLFFSDDIRPFIEKDERFFRNYYPTRSDRRATFVRPYIDCKFDFTSDDLVWRYAGNSVDLSFADEDIDIFDEEGGVNKQSPAGGSTAVIEGGIDLMKRSYNANSHYTAYYLSFLITIVRSSVFEQLRYLDEAEQDEDSGDQLAAGWQGAPVIFDTLFDRSLRQMFKSMLGIEFVLGALLDEAFCAITNSATSSALGTRYELNEDLVKLAVRDVTFKEMVLRVQASFGKSLLRRVFDLPEDVLGDDRKRAILSIASQ